MTPPGAVRSRILFGSVPASGHVRPGQPIARELVARGHEVLWYTSDRFRSAVERTGARHVGFTAGLDVDESDLEATFPGRAAIKPGLPQLKHDLQAVFIDTIPGHMTDLRQIVAETPVDAIVLESTFLAGAFLAEEHDLPWAVYGITPLVAKSVDCAPMGLALPPMGGPLGRLRNRALNLLVEKVVFAAPHRRFRTVRAELGLAPVEEFLDYTVARAPVYLQGTIPEFEYPRRDLPDNVHFVGALLPDPPGSSTLPGWWDDLDGGRPVVLVTQGTVTIDPDRLIHPAIEALAGEDVLVVVTTGGTPPEEILARHAAPDVRVERFIPFADLLPKVDVVVTNGGYGSTQQALAHGLPVVVAGVAEGKNEVAARVGWSGVGINLRTESPTLSQVRDAVRAVLESPTYRARARQLQASYAASDAGVLAADLIEGLLDGAAPAAR